MEQFLTEESPTKVVGLLAGAMGSLLFLFAVTVTGQSFDKADSTFPDPFNPTNVVAVLDNSANSYASFLQANLFSPAQQDYAFIADNVNYVTENAGDEISQLTGLNGLSGYVADRQQVAGESTRQVVSQYYPASSGGRMFGFLLGN